MSWWGLRRAVVEGVFLQVPLSLLECSLAALSFSLSASEALDEAALEAALDALHGVHQTRVGLSALETAFRRRLVLAHHVVRAEAFPQIQTEHAKENKQNTVCW